MNAYFEIINTVALFMDIENKNLVTMLKCLGAETKTYGKGEIILLAGEKPEHVGIVLSGQLHIIREDFDGNRSLMAAVTPGEIFAESLCCAGVVESPVTVVSDTDAAVMLLRFSRILHRCPSACAFHTQLIKNMLGLIASKNLLLQNRMEILGLKTVRAKVTRYLESFAAKKGRSFTIPFNREELADYLCVERSALSHELARMKKDGLIDYRKNKFAMLSTPSLHA